MLNKKNGYPPKHPNIASSSDLKVPRTSDLKPILGRIRGPWSLLLDDDLHPSITQNATRLRSSTELNPTRALIGTPDALDHYMTSGFTLFRSDAHRKNVSNRNSQGCAFQPHHHIGTSNSNNANTQPDAGFSDEQCNTEKNCDFEAISVCC